MLAEKIQLEDDEVILAQVRKHWFVVSLEMSGIIVVALTPLILYGISSTLDIIPDMVNQFSPLGLALYTSWLTLSWMALFGVWSNYYLDVWTVTSKRLIVVDQRGLFNRRTGSFRLERLQDVNVNVEGILATILNYGTIEAETASGDDNFIARSVPQPQELKAQILAAADKLSFSTTSHKAPNDGV
jgi:hypothetical protein